jgi:hypothetical protein
MKPDAHWVSNAKKLTQHLNASIIHLNTKLIHAMYTIRKVSLMHRLRIFSNRQYIGGSPKNAREEISALFIMIKLKREIQISVRRSDLPLLCKLSLTPKASLVMVTKVQMMEAI